MAQRLQWAPSGAPGSAPGPGHRTVVRQLAAAQKSNRGAGAYSRWINRPAGRELAAAAYRAGLSPNQVSLISALFTMPAIGVLAVLRPTWSVAAGVCLALIVGYALDSADGQLARLRGGGSLAGEWLDHVLDSLKICTFHLAVAVTWFRHYHLTRPALLLLPLGFTAVATVFFFALVLADLLRRVQRSQAGGSAVTTSRLRPHEPAPVLRSLMALPNDYGLLCLAALLLPLPGAFVATYAALLAANLLYLLAGAVRWFRELSRLG